jgi:hypothetical protein
LHDSIAAPQQPLQPIEIEVDNWRREQRQDLGQDQAADNRVAERLANLG